MEVNIAPGLVPTQVMLNIVELQDGNKYVQLTLATPTGVHVTFWEPHGATQFGQAISEAAKSIRSGLIIPDTEKVIDINKRQKSGGNGTDER